MKYYVIESKEVYRTGKDKTLSRTLTIEAARVSARGVPYSEGTNLVFFDNEDNIVFHLTTYNRVEVRTEATKDLEWTGWGEVQ